ncbi:MAG: CYTH domain-containing protein [Gammaproteobacteria bacterium]
MPVEIERKFLVINDTWRGQVTGRQFRQGYLSCDPERSVRVRLAGEQAWLTIKGGTRGATRAEYEYTIPVEHAREMLDKLCLQPLIEKTRYQIEYSGMTWEIDEFAGDNAGLLIAEVELATEGQAVDLPAWVGKDVTGDPRYYNASLIGYPYSQWSD